MRRVSTFIAMCLMGTGAVLAASRDTSTLSRNTSTVPVVGASRASTNTSKSSSRAVTARRTDTSQSRNERDAATSARGATNTAARNTAPKARAATNTTPRKSTGATTARAAISARAAANSTNQTASATVRGAANKSRAAVTMSASQSQTFGTGYNACRDAYFTCMDQFCANQNETYRRCVCSSRLSEIQAKERALAQASEQVQDFKDLNIEVIPKTAAEVNAMLSASAGEYAAETTKDKSEAAQKLAGISEVLSKAKSKSLSTSGALDIAGDINTIWSTTDLASGVNIASLTGEALYNAVHSQCAEMSMNSCDNTSTLNMVVVAYGMYIENDCSLLATNLDKRKYQADGTIRQTEREMNLARLENYNAHNSTSINDCIARVRRDITADSACGNNYVHCLDVTGKYLNRDTGAPIYTADFYQLETQISLSGDILNNQTNRMTVAELNNKRMFAETGLQTCRDLADEVWDEFMRQAITEIYQGQQEQIRKVKNECLDVVNQCYDEQTKSLKDFSNQKEQLLLGARMALSEEMCREKLDACSNLYGGGTNGLNELLNTMKNITDQKIAKECRAALQDFAQDICAVPSNDNLHSYPYACRVYAPGSQEYATIKECNEDLTGSLNSAPSTSGPITRAPTPELPFVCQTNTAYYTSCDTGYYLADSAGFRTFTPGPGTRCAPCTEETCPTNQGNNNKTGIDCGDYGGSLYQKLVRYALQVCVRPDTSEEKSNILPTSVLSDVNVVMDSIRVNMANVLAAECNRLGGYWVSTTWKDKYVNGTTYEFSDGLHDDTGHSLWQKFYNETGANTRWGYCTESISEWDSGYTTTPTKSGSTTEE